MVPNNDDYGFYNNSDVERERQLNQLVIPEDDEDDVFFEENETEQLFTENKAQSSESEPVVPEVIVKPEPAVPEVIAEPEPEPVVPEVMAKPEPEPVVPEVIAKPEPEPVVPEVIAKPEPEPVKPKPAREVKTDELKTAMDQKYRGNILTREDIDEFINHIRQSFPQSDTEFNLSQLSDKHYDAESTRDYAKYYIDLKRLYRDMQMR